MEEGIKKAVIVRERLEDAILLTLMMKEGGATSQERKAVTRKGKGTHSARETPEVTQSCWHPNSSVVKTLQAPNFHKCKILSLSCFRKLGL